MTANIGNTISLLKRFMKVKNVTGIQEYNDEGYSSTSSKLGIVQKLLDFLARVF